MRDDEQFNSIGEPAPIEEGGAWETIGRFAGLAIAAAGGVAIFTVLTAPTHVQGATASSKLKWQRAAGCAEPARTETASDRTNTACPAQPTLSK